MQADEAEAHFRRALSVAREQNARSLELRAAMSLATLERSRQAKRLPRVRGSSPSTSGSVRGSTRSISARRGRCSMSCLRPLLVEWPRSERGLPIVDPGVNTSSAPGPRQSPMMPLRGPGRPFLGTADGLRAMSPDGATPADEIHKSYRHGTHRTVAPTETLACVGPLMAQMGITRIANITGLDRIAPSRLVMVCRPNSRSIRPVSQGKGLDLAAAKTSGLMEAVETYHAETITSSLKLGSYRQLGRTHRLVDVAALPRPKGSPYSMTMSPSCGSRAGISSAGPRSGCRTSSSTLTTRCPVAPRTALSSPTPTGSRRGTTSSRR